MEWHTEHHALIDHMLKEVDKAWTAWAEAGAEPCEELAWLPVDLEQVRLMTRGDLQGAEDEKKLSEVQRRMRRAQKAKTQSEALKNMQKQQVRREQSEER